MSGWLSLCNERYSRRKDLSFTINGSCGATMWKVSGKQFIEGSGQVCAIDP